MSVQCPACQWPIFLDERGPPGDPSILLTGTAHVAGVQTKIIAVRVNADLEAAADYRSDVPRAQYHERGYDTVLDTILDEFEYVAAELGDLLGEGHSNIVELATGRYQLWIIPVSFGRDP